MQTIKRMPQTVSEKLGSNIIKGTKYFNQMNFSGIKQDDNIYAIDQNSSRDAENVFVDDNQRLVSRPSLQASELPDHPVAYFDVQPDPIIFSANSVVPSNYRLYDIKNFETCTLYISKSILEVDISTTDIPDLHYLYYIFAVPKDGYLDTMTMITNNIPVTFTVPATYSNVTPSIFVYDYNIVAVDKYIICFNNDNAQILDMNELYRGWQNFTDFAEIPVAKQYVSSAVKEYPKNDFIPNIYKEEYVWNNESQPVIANTGNASIILNSSIGQFDFENVNDINNYPEYRLLRPVNNTTPAEDLYNKFISVEKDVMCIATDTDMKLSFDNGRTFKHIYYPSYDGEFLNIAELSKDGKFFFFLERKGLHRYNIADETWSTPFRMQASSAHYGQDFVGDKHNTAVGGTLYGWKYGTGNGCYFLTGTIFAFFLYDYTNNVEYLYFKGPGLYMDGSEYQDTNRDHMATGSSYTDIDFYLLNYKTAFQLTIDNDTINCEFKDIGNFDEYVSRNRRRMMCMLSVLDANNKQNTIIGLCYQYQNLDPPRFVYIVGGDTSSYTTRTTSMLSRSFEMILLDKVTELPDSEDEWPTGINMTFAHSTTVSGWDGTFRYALPDAFTINKMSYDAATNKLSVNFTLGGSDLDIQHAITFTSEFAINRIDDILDSLIDVNNTSLTTGYRATLCRHAFNAYYPVTNFAQFELSSYNLELPTVSLKNSLHKWLPIKLTNAYIGEVQNANYLLVFNTVGTGYYTIRTYYATILYAYDFDTFLIGSANAYDAAIGPDPYIYHLWTNALDDSSTFRIDYVIGDTTANRKYNKVPTTSYADTQMYLGFDNLLQISYNVADTDDTTKTLFNLPTYNNQYFVDTITTLINISTTEVAVFFKDKVKICSKVSDDNLAQGFRYDYLNTRLSTGVRLGDGVINTLEGSFTVFPTLRGLAAMSYQAFMATSDQAIAYLSDDIKEIWTEFFNESIEAGGQIRVIQWRDRLFVTNNTINCLIYDLGRQAWWKWKLHRPVLNALTDQVLLSVITNKGTTADTLMHFDPEAKNYFDDSERGDFSNPINWFILSQPLHFNSPNYYKNIKQLVFQMSDSDGTKGMFTKTMNAQVSLFRKKLVQREPETVGFKITELRTFVKRFNYWKINELQWKLSNDTDTATPFRLELNGISVKYDIGEEVR